MIVTVERPHPPAQPPLSTQIDIAKFFNGSTPGAHITFTTPDGKKLLEMTGWDQAVPNHKDGTARSEQRPQADGSAILYCRSNVCFARR